MNEAAQQAFDRLYNRNFAGQHVDGMRLSHCEVFFEAGMKYVRADLVLPPFPTMLRKMWTGQEVQAWIDANWTVNPPRA